MAGRAAGAGNAGRRVLAAVSGGRGRSHPPGSCAGNVRRSGRAAALGVAGAGAVGTDDGDHPEPAWGVDPHRRHAVRSWPALLALADHAIAAADLVHADGVGRGAVHAAGRRRLVPAFGLGVGTPGRGALAAVCRRAYRGSDQASLSRDPRQARTHAAYPGAAAGAGANGDALERDDLSSKSHLALSFCLSMISAQMRSAFVTKEN